MRMFMISLLVLIFAPFCYAEDKQEQPKHSVLIYPKEILAPLPTINPPEDPNTNMEEFVEVESKSYPGLHFDLPKLNELVSIEKFQIRELPRTPEDYEMGGNPVMSWYGIHSPSGQLFNTHVVTDSLEKEE